MGLTTWAGIGTNGAACPAFLFPQLVPLSDSIALIPSISPPPLIVFFFFNTVRLTIPQADDPRMGENPGSNEASSPTLLIPALLI